MDIKSALRKVTDLAKKYRFPLLILALGLLLMSYTGKDTGAEEKPITEPNIQVDLNQELTEILSQIHGVGKVRVMLTVAVGQTTIYQYDTQSSGTSDAPSIRQETVILTDSNRNQQALVCQIQSETYRGAVIVCQGADNPQVRLAIVEAVSKSTGLGADRITVLKMK